MTLEAGQALAPHEALQIICLPGFSTATTVSEVSGRGVGMDAVQEAVRQVGGLLSITSVPGQGTVFTLTLPLTVSIIPVLTIETGGLTMAVPVAAVTRTLEVHSHDILSDGSGELFAVQGEDEPVPLLRLDQLIGRTVCLPAHGVVTVLVTDMGGGLAGVAVDRVVGQVELFAKPLGRPLSRVRGLSAGAMLGNGQVVFVLDLPGLLRTARTGRSAGGVC
jgi:two-component system chemotaxis sensor kinase CheA